MMKDGSLFERTFHRTEGVFYSRKKDVDTPRFIGGQVLPIRAQEIAPVEFLSARSAFRVEYIRERLRLGIVGHCIVSSGDQIVQSARFDLREVLLVRHPAVDHDKLSGLETDTLVEHVQHAVYRRAILSVAVVDLVRERKPIAVDHESDDNLFTIRTMIA